MTTYELHQLLKKCKEKDISECVNNETCLTCEIFIEFMKEKKENEND